MLEGAVAQRAKALEKKGGYEKYGVHLQYRGTLLAMRIPLVGVKQAQRRLLVDIRSRGWGFRDSSNLKNLYVLKAYSLAVLPRRFFSLIPSENVTLFKGMWQGGVFQGWE